MTDERKHQFRDGWYLDHWIKGFEVSGERLGDERPNMSEDVDETEKLLTEQILITIDLKHEKDALQTRIKELEAELERAKERYNPVVLRMYWDHYITEAKKRIEELEAQLDTELLRKIERLKKDLKEAK